MRGSLALLDKTGAERAGDIAERKTLIVAVIGVPFAAQEHMPGMVIVVVPLRAVFSARDFLTGIEQGCGIVVVFEHQMDVTPGCRGEFSGGQTEVMQHRDFA